MTNSLFSEIIQAKTLMFEGLALLCSQFKPLPQKQFRATASNHYPLNNHLGNHLSNHLAVQMCEALLKEEPEIYDPPVNLGTPVIPPPFPTPKEREELQAAKKNSCRSRKLSKQTRSKAIALELFG